MPDLYRFFALSPTWTTFTVCPQVTFLHFLINLKSVRKSLTPLPSVTFFKLEPSLVYHLALHPFTSCLSSD